MKFDDDTCVGWMLVFAICMIGGLISLNHYNDEPVMIYTNSSILN